MRFHDLKIWPMFYQPILDDIKRFEIRKNDRNFGLGDILHLHEWKDGEYTGRHSYWRVNYIIFNGPGVKEGYCLMGISGPWGMV